ncbi:MAG: DNA-formamidopyrimidine glycosylase [Sporomusaceae bacterium]|jgi:formamidopyrimidine-DNA glycosylase|nr:DNA-formamidopyrimidine glycosylase [Sporomusaceae bacterium]
MPEMPEVETIRRTLSPKVTGRRIENIEISLSRLIKYPEPAAFQALLLKKTITGLERRGKYLIFQLDSGLIMVVHLRMTGQLYYQQGPNRERKAHTHLTITFEDGAQLLYSDVRTFGAFYLLPPTETARISGLALLGPEPLAPDFTLTYLKETILSRKGKIKSLILNQNLIGGLGNIYADEALFLAGLDPEREGRGLTAAETNLLYNAINKVIQDGIDHGGTTFRDYIDGEGNKGSHQNYLNVYGRYQEPCPNCQTPLSRKKVAGRSSHYCAHCQK